MLLAPLQVFLGPLAFGDVLDYGKQQVLALHFNRHRVDIHPSCLPAGYRMGEYKMAPLLSGRLPIFRSYLLRWQLIEIMNAQRA